MLDIIELDSALKIKALGRMLTTKHPLLVKVKELIKLEDYFHPKLRHKVDDFTERGINLVGEDRRNVILSEGYKRNLRILILLKESRIDNWIKREARNSIITFDLRIRGIVKLGQLSEADINRVKPLFENGDFRTSLLELIPIARTIRIRHSVEDLNLYPINYDLVNLGKCSSKQIRTNRMCKEQVCIFKIGLILNPTESKTWLNGIKELTSTRHKNNLLRVAHGDVYSRQRLFSFGMVENNFCLQCGEVETIAHKLFTCERIARVWHETRRLTRVLANPSQPIDEVSHNLGAFLDTNTTLLTVHAEILTTIMRGVQGVPNCRDLVKNIITNLWRKESNMDIKDNIKTLLERVYDRTQ